MYHHLAPLAAFIGLIMAVAGSAAFGQKSRPWALALVAIGAVLNTAPYI